MTFPGKENLIFFEDLERHQERIYPDACDLGIVFRPWGGPTCMSMNIKAQAREHIKALMKIYKYKIERPAHARAPYDKDWKKATTTTMFIPFEFDEGRYHGVELKLVFEPHAAKKVEYLMITITRKSMTHAEFPGYQSLGEEYDKAKEELLKYGFSSEAEMDVPGGKRHDKYAAVFSLDA